ncbi:signal transduction histidine-protein kinase AtoS [Clostridium aceticum]|uniref:histidine kinase n=1 Tax=Clostridium aceticum TaxID=84022 RepID=A0A0D8IEL8_9CLOT|nr:transporter substrate-binding domain-containing protein [Clostridium aceticum]AKL93889.1 signal transduction histidine-protein kinase AtoS [Clostridium aceticum]KJF28718.1 hypothetical protein TZ02_02125 [Clostridium aceticum]
MNIKKVYLMIMIALLFLNRVIVIASAENADEIEPQKTISIAVELNMPPLQYIENHQPTGFHIDLLNSIGELQNISIEYVPMSLEKSIKALEDGEVDGILGVNYLAGLSENFMFTEALLNSSVGLVAKNSPEELTDMLIALKRNTVEYQYLQNVRRIQYHTTSNTIDAFNLMLGGRADAFIGDKVIAEYLLEKYALDSKYKVVSSYILPIEYSIAIDKESHSLLEELNSGLRQLKERGFYGEIYERWFVDEEFIMQKRLQQLMNIFIVFIILTMVVFIFSLRWNTGLRKEVSKKTTELQKINADLAYQVKETRNKSELIHQILQSSPRGMVTFDIEGNVTSYNPTAIEIIGIDENPMGKSYREVPLLQKLLEDKLQKVIEKHQQFLSEEVQWLREDGMNYHIRYIIYPLKNYEKLITGIMLSFEDNTIEKKIKAQLIEKEKAQALNTIVAGIAHEIRNPLTSIKTFVELIPEKLSNVNFQRDIVNYVPKEVERVDQLIENLIDYAKPKKPNKEMIDVQQLLETCCGLYKPIIKQKGLLLEIRAEKGLKIEADKGQIKQTIINFIINGIEAMEEVQSQKSPPLVLRVKGWKKENNVHIEIIDEGIGMTQEEIMQTFNPFYTTKPKGTGLGLALSKQFLEENGGKLKIESEKNIGTKMMIIFEGR